MTFQVAYETITQESAAECDVSEIGFIDRRGNRVPAAEMHLVDRGGFNLSLRDALAVIGMVQDDGNGHTFSTVDPERDYYDGSETYYTLCLPSRITPSSYRRVRRVLEARGLLMA